jgi:hypothetical protein
VLCAWWSCALVLVRARLLLKDPPDVYLRRVFFWVFFWNQLRSSSGLGMLRFAWSSQSTETALSLKVSWGNLELNGGLPRWCGIAHRSTPSPSSLDITLFYRGSGASLRHRGELHSMLQRVALAQASDTYRFPKPPKKGMTKPSKQIGLLLYRRRRWSAETAVASDRGDRRVMSPSILEECEQLRRAPTESSLGRRSRPTPTLINRFHRRRPKSGRAAGFSITQSVQQLDS